VLATIVGFIIFISVLLPWLLIAVVVVMVAYIFSSYFYRATAREVKVMCTPISSNVARSVLLP
jgi:hypothetical protein